MRVDYDKVQAAVKALGNVTDNDAFLAGFLSAFNFPSATYGRLVASTKKGVNQGLRIQGNGGVYFLASPAASLNSEFNIIKKNSNLSKIKEAFIVIVNETDVLAYERETGEMLESSKRDLHRYIEFFFSLLGIKPDAASEEMKSPDKKAAEKFAELYGELRMQNHNDSDDIAELLCRILFCCFTDSIGVLTNGGLRPLLANYTETSGANTSAFFCNLFEAMKQEPRDELPGYFVNVKYIDARLFGNSLPLLDFSRKARNLVLDLMGLDWADISPDVLGALIQSIIREEAGNSSGNYTSTANIQKVIGPLFMDGLYRNFERVQSSQEGCRVLLRRIKTISVFDPSSGAGNFLLVAYKELNKLAGKINAAIEGHKSLAAPGYPTSALRVAEDAMPYGDGLFVSWNNFYGIDNDKFACDIARLGFLFVVCQEARAGSDVKRTFTETIDVLFSSNIVVGNATRLDWETICRGNAETYLIGNPTYVGARKQTSAQKSDLARVFTGYSGISNLDYAACWFMLATKYICAHGGGFAFVTTNSLTQGEQVQLLWPKLFEKGVHIRFAYTSFKWRNDARNRTAVTVVVIGVAPHSNQQTRELFTSTAVFEPHSISPYLVPGDTIVKKRNSPLSQLPHMIKGNMPLYWSDYLLSHEEKVDVVLREPRAEKFLKKVVGADEFINGIERWCFWIPDADLEEAMIIPCIAERVERVRKARFASTDRSARTHAAHPHRFRETNETHRNSLVVPSVSSENRVYIPIGFVDKSIIVTNLAFVIYDCESWIFGVVASKMHNVWVRTVCGALETRIRYSSQLGYNTFPFPDISAEQKVEITQRVLAVIAARERYSGMTYAQWYDPNNMPDELRYAHYLLDMVIDQCYRGTPFVSDRDRLDGLFELYNKLGG
ncbi:MAG: DNA methyltransferase [Ruthenibacterium sp.]